MPICQNYVMDERSFLEEYADDRLLAFWRTRDIYSRTNGEFLALLNALYQTPLWQLDQYTVGNYTGQADGLNDEPRLVFAIKNLGASDACDHSMVICIPLYRRRVTFSAIRSLLPDQVNDQNSWPNYPQTNDDRASRTCDIPTLLKLLKEPAVCEHLRNRVAAIKGRCMTVNAQGMIGDRQPNIPRQYRRPIPTP